MKPQTIICLLLLLVFLIQPVATSASETDQYNLPPVPLADIGDEVTDHVADAIRAAVAKVNADIVRSKTCIDIDSPMHSKCDSVGNESRKLTYLRSNEAVAYETYKQLGFGTLLTTKIGGWLTKHKFHGEPAQYKTTYFGSIYLFRPVSYFTISPTVNLYGAQFGTDKLEHMFQQGYDYYTIRKKADENGVTGEAATKKAVSWGQMTERTYFGWMISGVYSNADLVANYAGMKFYEGLTDPIKMGDSERPAILVQKDGVWAFNESVDMHRDLIRPFLTEHLNEALNPSIYVFTLYLSVNDIVRERACPQWKKAFPGLTKNAAQTTTNSLTTWNGEDYGYLKKDRMVTIAGTCFSDSIAAK